MFDRQGRGGRGRDLRCVEFGASDRGGVFAAGTSVDGSECVTGVGGVVVVVSIGVGRGVVIVYRVVARFAADAHSAVTVIPFHNRLWRGGEAGDGRRWVQQWEHEEKKPKREHNK